MQRRSLLKLIGLAAAAQLPASAAIPEDQGITKAEPGPTFFFNQIGYAPRESKVATVTGSGANDLTFRLLRSPDDSVVFRGTLSAATPDAASGDLVRQASFSAFHTPGRYRLEAGGQRSEIFSIDPAVYAPALRLTMRAFYGQRCGCAVDLGGGYKHATCHPAGEYHASSGKSGALPNSGGWHDAGDYGRYVVNSGITCGTLLMAWEQHAPALRNLRLDIPATQPRLPDFLAEVLWNLQWMMSMQDGDGGVFHKQTSEKFCAFVMPERDNLTSEVVGTGSDPYKSTCATADFAAVMAMAARCYAEFNAPLAARCLHAARRAWMWATTHPKIVFKNPPGVSTGEYGDANCSDELLWASAELWRTTGEKPYEDAFLDSLPHDLANLTINAPSWGNVSAMGYWTYVLATRPGKEDVQTAIRAATKRQAAKLADRSADNGYGNTLGAKDYGWGSNSSAANHAMLLTIAHQFEANDAAVAAALNNLHYLLGRNCHGVSWVTQLGTRPFQHPHHRPSAADSLREPWPGLLSGGPNARPADPAARTLKDLPPMRMWMDDERAYSMNEIAINWNAPLVFLLAFANARR